jgi:hypothetical protein
VHNFRDGTTITGAGAVVINGSDPTFTGTININGTLVFSSGSLFGVHTFTGTGVFNWTGGTLRGGGAVTTIASGFRVAISGADNKSINHGSATSGGHRLINNGTITWTGAGNIQGGDGSIITNAAGALFDVQTDASFVYQFGATPAFNNQAGATFRKSAGAGATNFPRFNFNNSGGTVDIQIGALTFNDANASHNLSDGTTITGAGAVVINGSDPTFTGTINLGGTLELASGDLFGIHTFTGTGAFNWTGGSLRGGGSITTIANGLRMSIAGDADKTLLHGSSTASGHRLINNSMITWTGAGNIRAGDGSTITNAAGALFDAQSNASFVYAGFGNAPSFTNEAGAIFRKSASAGTTAFAANFNFNNSGTLELLSGTFSESNGFAQTGGQITLNGGNLSTGTARSRCKRARC